MGLGKTRQVVVDRTGTDSHSIHVVCKNVNFIMRGNDLPFIKTKEDNFVG